MPTRPRQGVMLAKPFAERLLEKMSTQVIIQPKIDGVRMRAIWDPALETYELLSSTARKITGLPHIVEQLTRNAKEAGYFPTLDGEAYVPGWKLQQIQSVVSCQKRVDQYHWMISFYVFDQINEEAQAARIFQLISLKESIEDKNISVVTSFCINKKNWADHLPEILSAGYEGIIIRDSAAHYKDGKQSCILKVKPQREDNYKITGCSQAISIGGEPKGMIGAFNLIDALGNPFEAGAGRLTHQQRTFWWIHKDQLPGRILRVKYLTFTSRGVPREPIALEVI